MSEHEGYGGGAEEELEEAPPARRPPAVPGVRRSRPARRKRATVGGIIGSGFTVWVRNLLPFLALTVLVFSPYVALQLWLWSQPLEVSASLPWLFGGMALQWLLGYLVTGAVIHGVFQQLRGRRASIGETLGRGAARVPAVVGVGVVAAICMYAPMLPGWFLFLFDQEGLGAVLLLAGLIPMVMIACGLFIAIPVSVVERPGVLGAVRRSWALSRGYKGTIFGVLFLYGVAAAVLSGITLAVLGLALGGDVRWAGLAVTLLTTSVNAVFAAVAYHDIRVSKEGIVTEELAAIFD